MDSFTEKLLVWLETDVAWPRSSDRCKKIADRIAEARLGKMEKTLSLSSFRSQVRIENDLFGVLVSVEIDGRPQPLTLPTLTNLRKIVREDYRSVWSE
jgi:hypothetical protein